MLPKVTEISNNVTNDTIQRKTRAAIEKHVKLLTMLNKRKQIWAGHMAQQELSYRGQ